MVVNILYATRKDSIFFTGLKGFQYSQWNLPSRTVKRRFPYLLGKLGKRVTLTRLATVCHI